MWDKTRDLNPSVGSNPGRDRNKSRVALLALLLLFSSQAAVSSHSKILNLQTAPRTHFYNEGWRGGGEGEAEGGGGKVAVNIPPWIARESECIF